MNMMFDNEDETFQFMRNYGSSVGKEFSRSTKFLKGSKKLDSATFFCRGKRSFCPFRVYFKWCKKLHCYKINSVCINHSHSVTEKKKKVDSKIVTQRDQLTTEEVKLIRSLSFYVFALFH